MKVWNVLPLAALLAGCAIDEADFPEIYGSTYCKRFAECEKGDFEDLYDGDMDACVDDAADLVDFVMDAADLLGQEYDPEAARECVKELKKVDCGDLDEGIADCDLYE